MAKVYARLTEGGKLVLISDYWRKLIIDNLDSGEAFAYIDDSMRESTLEDCMRICTVAATYHTQAGGPDALLFIKDNGTMIPWELLTR